MRRLALALLTLASAAAAQEGTIELRDAVVHDVVLRADTTGMVAMTQPDGWTVYVGDLLLELGSGDVEAVGIDFDPFTNVPLVSLALAPEASEAFARISGARIGKAMAIVFDGQVLSTPRIQSRIEGGRISIEGVSLNEAEVLAESIRQAVGGASPREFFRQTLDTSTPEATVDALGKALQLGDALVVARLLHPRAVKELREGMGSTSIRLVGDRAELLVGEFDGESVPLADVIGPVPPGTRFTDLSDVDAVALVFALSGATGLPIPLWSGLTGTETLGAIAVENRVYVVRGDPVFEAGGFTSAMTVAVERIEEDGASRWVVLLPTD
ncbi:MAG: hypothetical protein AAFQ43_02945 [Bacteroidota bacterium]